MATPTWSQLTFLTAAQQAKAADFAAIGAQLGPGGSGSPDTSGVTYSQAKAAAQFLKDLQALVGPANKGVQHVLEKSRTAAVATYDAANP